MGISALYAAATGMDAQLKSIDVIANNVANLNTVGFRKDRVNFADLFYHHQVLAGGNTGAGGANPHGVHMGHGAKLVSVEKLFEAGGIIMTESPTNIAIEGGDNLFFRVVRPSGEAAYTRAGNFTRNELGQFVTPSGDLLDPQITIPGETPIININSAGIVTATDGINPEEQVGEITLHRFVNPAGLRPDGDNLFFETPSSGPPQEIAPGTQGGGRLLQGAVEGSNVQAITELIKLIQSQRAYEINSNVIRTSDEALQIANNLRG